MEKEDPIIAYNQLGCSDYLKKPTLGLEKTNQTLISSQKEANDKRSHYKKAKNQPCLNRDAKRAQKIVDTSHLG